MIHVGSTYIERDAECSRLCADVTSGQYKKTLWFSVDHNQERYLCLGRSDAFVLALLPMAMRGRHEIVCEDELSEQLRYQLCDCLIPALSHAGDMYHLIKITAPLTNRPYPNEGAVGTGFSGGVDSLYTIYRHGTDSEYPLTHVAVFSAGVFDDENMFRKSCRRAERFAGERGLETVFVNTNLDEALPERFIDVFTFRIAACVLALQGLFHVYYLSSSYDISSFSFDLHDAGYFELLMADCINTSSLTCYPSGFEKKRIEKVESLTEWDVSYSWLHSCIYGYAGDKNCGHCKKCTRDLTTLYALGKLDKYERVYDIAEFDRYKALRIGFILANRGNCYCDDVLSLYSKRNVQIPKAAYIYEKQFSRAMDNLETWQKEGNQQ